MKIGKHLAKIRKANNMTQIDVATQLNISPQAVSKWERDENYPELSVIPLLAEIYNTTTDYIFGYKATPNNTSVEVNISKNDLLYMIQDMDVELDGLADQPFHTLDCTIDNMKFPVQFVQDERNL